MSFSLFKKINISIQREGMYNLNKMYNNKGYAFKGIKVNLTNYNTEIEYLNKEYIQYLGGRGLTNILLLEDLKDNIEAFSEENEIIISAGILAGTGFPGADRINIGTKNPYNNGIGSGSAGGDFAEKLKGAGFDYIKVVGCSKNPVYLYIDNEKVNIKNAKELWGKDTLVTSALIKKENKNDDISTLRIGPAGEKEILSACVLVGNDRVVGRCGIGAIFGHKKLKAVAVYGNNEIHFKGRKKMAGLIKKMYEKIENSETKKTYKEVGTLSTSPMFNPNALNTGKNFSDPTWEGNFKLGDFKTKIINTKTCPGCPIHCIHEYENKDGIKIKKLEANSLSDLGSRVGISDANEIIELQDICQREGFDVDNLSGVIAWAIECYEKGLIKKEQTDGLELEWGNINIIKKLIDSILKKENIGKYLALGCKKASEMIGNGTNKYCIHIKNQELYERLRDSIAWALGVCVSERAGTHTRGAPLIEFSKNIKKKEQKKIFGFEFSLDELSTEGKVDLLIYYERYLAVLDSVGVCYFVTNWVEPNLINPDDILEAINIIFNYKFKNILDLGEKIHITGKLFNMIHTNFNKADDFPPKRMMEEKIKKGRYEGYSIKKDVWEKLLVEYYKKHGWDENTSFCKIETLKKYKIKDNIISKIRDLGKI